MLNKYINRISGKENDNKMSWLLLWLRAFSDVLRKNVLTEECEINKYMYGN